MSLQDICKNALNYKSRLSTYARATLDEKIGNVSTFVPLTYIDIIRRNLWKSANLILDVGCGRGLPMKVMNRQKKFYSVGVDLFMPYLKEAKKERIHDEYVLCDVCCLPFREKSFDVALCLEVIDHLSKNDGRKLLKELEQVASAQIIMSAHVGFHPLVEGIDDNPLQVHKSGWMPKEFKSLGFKVRGQGFRYVYRSAAGAFISVPRKLLSYTISYLLVPCTYFTPDLAAHMVCVKTRNE
jgi:SAM-dependent methyltransferase